MLAVVLIQDRLPAEHATFRLSQAVAAAREAAIFHSRRAAALALAKLGAKEAAMCSQSAALEAALVQAKLAAAREAAMFPSAAPAAVLEWARLEIPIVVSISTT